MQGELTHTHPLAIQITIDMASPWPQKVENAPPRGHFDLLMVCGKGDLTGLSNGEITK